MEINEAKHLVFTVKEVVEALVDSARKSGVEVPDFNKNMSKLNVDGNKGIVECIVVCPKIVQVTGKEVDA